MAISKCIRFSLFLVMMLIMVQGCSAVDYLTFHGDTQRTGFVADAGPLTDNIRWSASPGSIDCSPAVADGRVFVATGPDMAHPEVTPALYCYDTDTGEELWTYDAGSECGITVAGDLLLVGGLDGNLTALNTADGSEAWSVVADENAGFFGLSSSPLYYDGLIYQLTPSDGGLHVYDPADGSETWSVAFGAWDVGWTSATYFTAPAAADGVVYFPSNLSELYAYNTATREEYWNVTLDGTIKSAPVIDTNSLFVTTATTLYEVSLTDGSVLTSRSMDTQMGTPALASGNDRLYVGTGSGMVCLDTADITAAPLWEAATAKMTVSPVIAGNLVYGATNEEQSSVYAFDTGDGSEVWSYTLPAPEGGNYAAFWGSSPAVADGVLYIGAEYTNTLFAFGENVTPIEPVVIYDGSVNVVEGATFTFVPSNNASASYTINRTTDLGALDVAATDGGFTFNASDAWYDDYGSFLLEDVNGIANDDWTVPNAHSWALYLNGAPAPVGLGGNDLSDGDRLTFYYCPSDPVTYAYLIDQATYIVEIDVTVGITPEYIFDGGVTVEEGVTFTFVPSNNASASYTINRTTDLGALETAATRGGFTFNASDAWYASYGSFLLEDVNGIANEDWTVPNAHSWALYLNGAPAPVGLGANDLSDGDTLTFYYCPSDPVTYAYLTDEATYIVEIDVTVGITPEYIYDGGVTVAEGVTFAFVPSNNASASYTINRTTDLGALDTAATRGGFTFNASDAWYASYGSFLLEDVNGIANEDWTVPNAHSWALYLNGAQAPAGLGANDLSDGDTLTFYYCPSDPVTYAYLTNEATYIVEIDVSVITPEYIFDGGVTVEEGATFDFVPSNNASASYTINRTTDLGALDVAATEGGFTFNASDAWYASYGSFLLEDINGIANEDWTVPNAHSWALYLNGATAPVGLGGNELENGDTLTLYYCPTDPVTWAPLIDEATYIVDIDVTVGIEPEYIFDGSATVYSGETFTFVPSNNASASYTVNRTTDLGALDTAATLGGFTFNASDAWYASYGSFLLEDVNGIANEDWTVPNAHSWALYLNGAPAPVGLGANNLVDGDTLTFYFCPSDPVTYAYLTDEATYVVNIDVIVSPVKITDVLVTGAARGGTSDATISVTAQEAGWYVVVLSGVNSGGDSLAGIATVRLGAGEILDIPALIAIPQQAQTGTYTLYAGVYTRDGYPDDLLTYSEGVSCVVS